jgi:hypothetical protein
MRWVWEVKCTKNSECKKRGGLKLIDTCKFSMLFYDLSIYNLLKISFKIISKISFFKFYNYNINLKSYN